VQTDPEENRKRRVTPNPKFKIPISLKNSLFLVPSLSLELAESWIQLLSSLIVA
jgi:hypothetical protein